MGGRPPAPGRGPRFLRGVLAVCPVCEHAQDDHEAKGCLRCISSGGPCTAAVLTIGPSATVCLAGRYGIRPWRQVEMPAATTARFAAKRIAEAFGLDPDAREYILFDPANRRLIDQDEVMAEWDGKAVVVAVVGE